MKEPIIFTDLDGTLLDEKNYSYQEALPALSLISSIAIPLIFCSSKTRAELETFRFRLGNAHPFISENGGGIYIPQGYFNTMAEAKLSNGYQLISLGTPYEEIRKQFIFLRDQSSARVRGFADMSVTEVAALTGLSEQEAALARQRDFDEAFVFEGKPEDGFLRAIEESGLRWTQGKIFHIMGGQDKGRAVSILMSLYKQEFGEIVSMALGDSLNDLPMLMAVDIPVLIKHNDGSFDPRIKVPNILKTQLPGPSGWNETVLRFLEHESGKGVLGDA